jgi:hypothetical protein
MEKREFEILIYKTEKEIKKKKGKLFNNLWGYHFKSTPPNHFPKYHKKIFKSYWDSQLLINLRIL